MANESSMAWLPIRDALAKKSPIAFDRRLLFAVLLTAIGYYAGSLVGFALTFHPHPVSVLWPPNSILLAGLLLTPPRAWAIVLLAALPAHIIVQLQSGVPVPMMVCYFISNSCEAIIGAFFTRWLISGPIRFDTLRCVAVFCVFGALAGPFFSSFLDAGFVKLNQWGAGTYGEILKIRFFSNVLTALTFTPVILVWANRSGRRQLRDWKLWAEASLLLLVLFGVCYAALGRGNSPTDPALYSALILLLLWTAIRLGPRGTTSAILFITCLTIWSAAHGHGPFAADSPEQNARSIQLFLIVMAIPFLFLAAGMAERRTAEERFTKAFRVNPAAVMITRLSDGVFLDVNEKWLAMFGYTRDEIIGRTVFDIGFYVSLADRAAIVARIDRDGQVRDLEISARNKNGGLLPILYSAEPIETDGGSCLIAVARDITELKRAEDANRNLAHASRLAVVGELTASIAHEINQPLGAILSNADAATLLLESDSPPLDELRNILTDIHNDDVRASETIRHIRMLTRKHRMQMEWLDFNDVAAEVLRLVSFEARRRNISLLTELTDAPLPISGDQVHLQQVLMNLVLNSMEAMAGSSEGPRQILLRTEKDESDQTVRVTVTDWGRGVGPDELPRLFESFYTTKENGMGLGLAIARSMVEAHGGRISAEHNPEGGAIFRFDLPLSVPP